MSLQGIQLASQAVRAHQRALELTGQNIANANTVGYSRQTTVLRSVGPADTAGNGTIGGVGGGVDATLAVRSHAAWLDRSADSLRAQVGGSDVKSQLATRVEELSGEPGTSGLQATMDRFFTAYQAVADNPNDISLRSAAIRSAGEVADRFAQQIGDLELVRQDTLAAAQGNVDTVNSLTKQVASLSAQIGSLQSTGQPASELLDQRDQLLEQLTTLTGASVSGREGGDVVVALDGATLVQGDHAEQIQLRSDATLTLRDGTALSAPGGELAARLDAINTAIPGYQSRLAGIRDAFSTEVNRLQTSGKDLDGNPGIPIFISNSAGVPNLNPALRSDPRRLVTGNGAAGDGSIARSVAGLRTNEAILPAYRSVVNDLANEVTDSARLSTMAKASLSQIQEMQASQTGVNLDEELASMVAQQHVYAASARLLSTYDQMLDTLIQRTGT